MPFTKLSEAYNSTAALPRHLSSLTNFVHTVQPLNPRNPWHIKASNQYVANMPQARSEYRGKDNDT
eukprot:333139-Hanusia_phi.AAC.1